MTTHASTFVATTQDCSTTVVLRARGFTNSNTLLSPVALLHRSPNHYERLVKFGLNDVESVIENGVALAGAGEDPMVLGRSVDGARKDFGDGDHRKHIVDIVTIPLKRRPCRFLTVVMSKSCHQDTTRCFFCMLASFPPRHRILPPEGTREHLNVQYMCFFLFPCVVPCRSGTLSHTHTHTRDTYCTSRQQQYITFAAIGTSSSGSSSRPTASSGRRHYPPRQLPLRPPLRPQRAHETAPGPNTRRAGQRDREGKKSGWSLSRRRTGRSTGEAFRW